MTVETKQEVKRWLISSGVTFLATFCATMATELRDLTLGSVGLSTFVGIVGVAVRAGFKALVEFLPLLFVKK